MTLDDVKPYERVSLIEPEVAATDMWNRFAVIGFMVNVVVFVGSLAGVFLTLLGQNAAGGPPDLFPPSVAYAVALLGYVPGLVFGHLALGRTRRHLRGRNFGSAALVVGYFGVVVSVVSLLALLGYVMVMLLVSLPSLVG